MGNEQWILGVDAGNTKTLAFVARRDGSIAGVGRSGCGDIYGAASPEAAMAAVEIAIETALREANADRSDLSASAFSMAGADWPEDFDFIRDHMKQLGLGEKMIVVNDAIGGLYAGAPDRRGVSVVLGTGAAIGAKGYNGSVWHGSFWIRRLGSGYFINEAYNAIIFAELGLGEPTVLARKVLHIFESESVEDFLHSLSRREDKKFVENRVIVGAILDAAVEGDEAATSIVDDFANRSADYALTAAKKVGIDHQPFYLVFSGGMCRHSSHLLENKIAARVRREFPNMTVVLSPFEPVIGALLLGFETRGIEITERIKANLDSSMPDFSHFES